MFERDSPSERYKPIKARMGMGYTCPKCDQTFHSLAAYWAHKLSCPGAGT